MKLLVVIDEYTRTDGQDSGPNGLNLDLINNPSFVPGLLGNAISLDGTSYASRPAGGVPDPEFNLGAGDFTIQVWVNWDGTVAPPLLATTQFMMGNMSGDGGPTETGFVFYGSHHPFGGIDTTRYNFNSTGGVPLSAQGNLLMPETAGVWHQMIMRRTGASLEMIRDGDTASPIADVNVGTDAYKDTSAYLAVGAFSDLGGAPAIGLLDDVAIWKRALDDNEIADLYNNGLGSPITGTVTPITEVEWRDDIAGDWNRAGNWSPSRIPDATTMTAIFGDAIQQSRTVFTDTHVTVKAMQFLNSNTYAVGGTGSINLNSGTTAPKAAIDVFLGDHEFQARVNLEVDTDVTIVSGAFLAFNNTLNLGGHTLTKTGSGELEIRNTLTTGGGTVNILEGTLSGNGAIGGDVNNDGGTISPGDSAVGAAQSVIPEPGAMLLLLIGMLVYSCVALRTSSERARANK